MELVKSPNSMVSLSGLVAESAQLMESTLFTVRLAA